MEKKKKQAIAMFRFGVISGLIGLRRTERGERERRIKEITLAEWDIPGSPRSHVSRSAVLEWVKRYEASGKKLESLFPKERADKGSVKSMDEETQAAIVLLRKEFRHASLPVLMDIAKERGILPVDFKASLPSVYRLLKLHGMCDEANKTDRRKFEAETSNDLWQSDCMYGPYVPVNGKKRRSYLIAVIDDHSRLIAHAEFYLNDTAENVADCFEKAFKKRGLPRKIYVDNGPSFKARHLRYTLATLGTALVHAKPYVPQGKGKIERWFRTVRMRLLPALPRVLDLARLNAKLSTWIDEYYHVTEHSGIKDQPLRRYLRQLHLIRPAPSDLRSYFRLNTKRKVNYDRSVSFGGKLFEAPVGLTGKTVILRFHKNEPERRRSPADT